MTFGCIRCSHQAQLIISCSTCIQVRRFFHEKRSQDLSWDWTRMYTCISGVMLYQLSYLALGSKVVGRKDIKMLVFGAHVFHQINWTTLGDLHANIHTWSYMLMMWVCGLDPHSNPEIFPCKNTITIAYDQINMIMDNLWRNQAWWMLGVWCSVPPPPAFPPVKVQRGEHSWFNKARTLVIDTILEVSMRFRRPKDSI